MFVGRRAFPGISLLRLAEVVDDPVGFAWEFLPDRHPVEAAVST